MPAATGGTLRWSSPMDDIAFDRTLVKAGSAQAVAARFGPAGLPLLTRVASLPGPGASISASDGSSVHLGEGDDVYAVVARELLPGIDPERSGWIPASYPNRPLPLAERWAHFLIDIGTYGWFLREWRLEGGIDEAELVGSCAVAVMRAGSARHLVYVQLDDEGGVLPVALPYELTCWLANDDGPSVTPVAPDVEARMWGGGPLPSWARADAIDRTRRRG